MGQYAVIDRRTPSGTSLEPELYPDGYVIVVDKPYGWTSADAVRKIKFGLQKRYRLRNVKVGHAGTLDPLATGVLLVCVGKATKVSESLQSERKEYLAEVTFGATTPSFDKEQEIDARYPYEHITLENVRAVLESMHGVQHQLPPVYSAKYVDGVRAYEKARQGEAVELRTSEINIYGTQVVDFALPVLKVAVQCSKGTYIRAFARDLGTALGSGAYLTGLVRTVSGGFSIDNALSIQEIETLY
ncbi:MAG TPA: tRNA pseudouridine(55) synthase TruB [Candidatus Coprenecus stercoravium]|uniref:tRNA pseudouridine synthase B n=1 Tax=Candidatus Coprenecus stercoravium TaxID=2840735 RepID=A0A9D2KAL0_9BACT|nr:tRNA pseudouridine(55) synthase TruB [Candidatus Coprenecus stercoravium]